MDYHNCTAKIRHFLMSFLQKAGENKVENEKSFWGEGLWRTIWKMKNVSAENEVESESLKSDDSEDDCLRKDFRKYFQVPILKLFNRYNIYVLILK